MAVYSRFGGTVEIVRGNLDKGEVDFWTLDNEGNRHRFHESYIAELKADGGLAEIANIIRQANEREEPVDEREKHHLTSESYGSDDDMLPPDLAAQLQ